MFVPGVRDFSDPLVPNEAPMVDVFEAQFMFTSDRRVAINSTALLLFLFEGGRRFDLLRLYERDDASRCLTISSLTINNEVCVDGVTVHHVNYGGTIQLARGSSNNCERYLFRIYVESCNFVRMQAHVRDGRAHLCRVEVATSCRQVGFRFRHRARQAVVGSFLHTVAM